MKIDLHYSNNPPFTDTDLEQIGLGGTEGFIVQSARELARQGHQVRLYNRSPIETESSGVFWSNISRFKPQEDRDVFVSFRMREIFKEKPKGLKAIILADTESYGLGDEVREGLVDLVMFVSRWQKDKIAAEEGIPEENCLVTANGIKLDEFNQEIIKTPGMCIHTSTPERGLTQLLDIWPKIQVLQPNASLHLFSSYFGWGATPEKNQEMCAAQYAQAEFLAKTGHNVVNHIHVGAAELREWQLRAELFLYPTAFKETCCISSLEASAAGCVHICSDVAALRERAVDGVTGYLIPGEVGTSEHDWQFVSKVNELLMDSEKTQQMSQAAREYAKSYDFGVLVKNWIEKWQSP
jgi:glycosyltransferase involved in cell wall biosynthesis